MPDITLTPTSPLDGLVLRIGANQIVERSELALTSVAITLGQGDVLARRFQELWGLSLPGACLTSIAGDWRAVSMTEDQILLMSPGDGSAVEREVRNRLEGIGYTTNQTDAWVCLEVSGPDTPAALERICPINLAAGAFPETASSRTVMEHMGALVIRTGPEHFLLCSASSSARSFEEAIETSYRNVIG